MNSPWAQENFPFPTIVVRGNLREDAFSKIGALDGGCV